MKKRKPQKKQQQPKKRLSDDESIERLKHRAFQGLRVMEKYNNPNDVHLDERYRPIIKAIVDTAVSPTGYATQWGTSYLAKQCVIAAYVLGRDRKRPKVKLDVAIYHLLAQVKDLDDDDNINELGPLAASLWATMISVKLQTDPAGRKASAFNHIYAAYRIGMNRRMKTYEQRTSNK